MIEVLGVERGTSMYTMGWLVERVLWHLDPKNTNGRVFLTEDPSQQVTGHAIARIDPADPGEALGYFSTIFVDPSVRNQGVATSLLDHVERWFREMKMPKIVYNTAENHSKLIRLFERHRESEMVQLTKTLD